MSEQIRSQLDAKPWLDWLALAVLTLLTAASTLIVSRLVAAATLEPEQIEEQTAALLPPDAPAVNTGWQWRLAVEGADRGIDSNPDLPVVDRLLSDAAKSAKSHVPHAVYLYELALRERPGDPAALDGLLDLPMDHVAVTRAILSQAERTWRHKRLLLAAARIAQARGNLAQAKMYADRAGGADGDAGIAEWAGHGQAPAQPLVPAIAAPAGAPIQPVVAPE